jgi:hypothetical protein
MMNLINKNNITDYTFIEAVDGNENLDHLINNSINHEEIWYDYLKSVDTKKYNIYNIILI